MTNIPTNNDDVIDSRDIVERIGELQAMEEPDEDEKEELASLLALQDECSHPEWDDGVTLIRDSYFKNYARELAEDIGGHAMDGMRWPFTCIDWNQAARDLRQDYTSVEFDGVDYWVRS